jgi:hypothetical protein
MSQTLAVDSANDLYTDGAGNLVLLSGVAAVQQNCDHALKTTLGECVLDLPRGLPNFEAIWNGRPNLAQYQAAAVAALQEVEGVVQVVAFEPIRADDTLQYTATIQTIYGPATL